MRAALAVVLLAGCTEASACPAFELPTYITIADDAVPVAGAVAGSYPGLEVLESEHGVAVVAFPPGKLHALAEQLHEVTGRCGGFMMHDSLAEAYAALEPPRDPIPVDYTLDRAAIVQDVLPALDRERLLGTIRDLSAMQNRYYLSQTGAAASVWLRDLWRSFSDRTDVTVELIDHGWPQKSVMLTIPGTTRAHEVIVIGGHLDSIARGGSAADAPGADDDASGIATLTEVARVLLSKDFRPARTIELIAYAAEEVGLRGSQAIAKDHAKRGVQVVGALQLDMTAYQGSDRDIWLMKDFTSKAQNDFLIELIEKYVGATYGLDACGYACSDHASWYRTGVPASMPFESRMAERNRSIHTRADTLETSGNNADHAIKFARLAASYAIELGKGELGGGAPAPSRSPAAALILLALAAAVARLTRPA
jgi:bacterial leucyl aminopeptidase